MLSLSLIFQWSEFDFTHESSLQRANKLFCCSVLGTYFWNEGIKRNNLDSCDQVKDETRRQFSSGNEEVGEGSKTTDVLLEGC